MAEPAIRDPITFEVVKNALASVADEMAVTVVRTAHSQVVRDSLDFSTAICDAHGRLVAQGLCLPLHLGSIPDAMAMLLRKYAGDIHPQDVFILNDPEEGGMHLPDIFLFKPIFQDNQLLGFAVCVAHYPDIGGRTAGGNAVDSTEIYQEGLQIPLLKLYHGGRRDEALFSILKKNVRIPDIVMGDLSAQMAACHIGEEGYLRLVGRYGIEGLQNLIDEILDYTERMLRAELGKFPVGTYSFEDYIDDDGFGSGPITICVSLTFSEDSLVADFTGTSPQVRSALNATVSITKSAVYTALKCVVPSTILSNDGFYRPIQVMVPRGTILNPTHPAARAARGLTAFRTVDTILGALYQVLPSRIGAAGEGGATMISIGGERLDDTPFVFVDFLCGGWGGRPHQDGIDGASNIAANLSNVPVEEVELYQPVQVEEYGFVRDTGGAGKFRGCLSVARQIRFLEQEGILHIRSDRRRFPPYGLDRGQHGTSSWNILNPGPDQEALPTHVTRPIVHGDVLRHMTAGGGGFGDPLHRDPRLVLQDVLDEKISREHALREYGVVVTEAFDVDDERTLRERVRRRAAC